ncbi:putative rRNA maturation factor [Mycoplasmopsis mustelae]|uniref:Endoribonuclease YbeY n=1 Tax=Mycoplasmopsis mustelae TaxID=171289 RepID=A0A4R7UC33_9BACT|nr:rRNA maturation RNase YbeY [Mycoplasmopsis mustelae]TDV23287.1 putative rRNA maturation factor [Mycoplasmopsis mustelae]
MLNYNIELNVSNRSKKVVFFEKEMNEILQNFAKYFKISPKKTIILDVSFVSKNKIKQLNYLHRGKDCVTDILSFGFDQKDLYQKLPMYFLGELVICWDKMLQQAKDFNHSIRREFCYLFTHGLVHLQGYDHEIEAEKIQMDAIVDKIFNPLKISREK